jgi:hypothetical protein
VAGNVVIEEVTLGRKTRQDSAPSGFYFALEGKGTRGNEVLWGTAFDLIFNYARPPEYVLARLKGEKLADVVEANAELGIDVVPKGLTLIDSVAHQTAKFEDGKIIGDPPRFLLKAPPKEDDPEADERATSPPICRSSRPRKLNSSST